MISEGLTLDWGVGARGRGKEKEQRRVWFRNQDRKCGSVLEAGEHEFFFLRLIILARKERKKKKSN